MTMEKAKEKHNFIIPKEKDFFERLYNDHYTSLVRFCEGIIYDSNEAMDIVQEVFLEIWQKSNRLEIEVNIKTYLFACVKFKAFNRIKKLNIIDRHEGQLKEAFLSAQDYDGIPDQEIKDEIRKVIDSFPNQMRQILEYHNLYGWKYQEIADELDISVNTVKTQIKRAYKRFRKEFNSNLINPVVLWYLIDRFF